MNCNEKIPQAPQYIKDFEQLGFGMFVHLGLYSKLNRGEWVYHINNLDKAEYQNLKNSFNLGSMKQIVDVAKSAGCKYIVLTTRHHDGFSLYDTRGLNDYDIMHTPSGRDVIAEFVSECRNADIVPFFYHTTLDWMNEDFENDFDKYLDYLYKSVEILCTNYGEIGGLWFDGNWSKPDSDWQENRLYKMIHHYQPNAIIINNTGLQARGKFGDEEIDSVTFERGKATERDLRGRKKYVAAEMCETLCDNWGVADDINFKTVKTLIEELCECRKAGANFLLNIGPNADGSVSTMQRGIMECIGRWMDSFGEAIYNGRPYISYDDKPEFFLKHENDPDVLYLFRFNPQQCYGDKNVTLDFSEDSPKIPLFDKFNREVIGASWLDNGEQLSFIQDGDKLKINFTAFPYGQSLCVRVAKVLLKSE